MSNLLALRGVSGSGKSTYAQELKAQGWVIVSRDDIREAMFKDYASVDEDVVTVVQDAAINAALAAGKRVVIDDTNIRVKYLKRFVKFAHKHGALFQVKEIECDLNQAIWRVNRRAESGGRHVPEGVIRKQFQGMKARIDWDEVYNELDSIEFKPYVHPEDKPWAILVDVDGTLAHNDGHRGWYDYSKVYDDIVKDNIAGIVKLYHNNGHKVIIMSGRDDVCWEDTARWLDDNDIPWDEIRMRKTGDQRKDSIVKLELFDEHVRDRFKVEFVLDDRQQVVDAWRSIGLTCLQVAPGDF